MPVPTTPGPKGLSSAAGSYLKSNAKFAYGGGIGLAFLAADAKNILDADNKLKALLKTAKDFILIRIAMVGIFTGVRDAIRGLVKDTGSLDAALKRLTQVQQYSRQFATFTGSLAAAKQKIIELHQLSTRGVFNFEDLIEANKSLQVFTRGAFSSVDATKTVGEAAIATGNSIQDTARAVGSFYDELRAGQPVGAAAEQLRQMNLISASTADELTNMADSGSSVKTTFDELTDALKKAGQGAKGYKDELQGVTEAHAKAANELKVAFGAPWTDKDIQSQKNMAEGMKAITPAIAELSKGFAFLYNGAATFTSWLFKIVAGSKLAQDAIVVLGRVVMVLTVAFGVFSVAAVGTLIPIIRNLTAMISLQLKAALQALGVSFFAATRAAVLFNLALSTIAIGSIVLMIAGFVASMVGAFMRASEELKQVKKDFQDWKQQLSDTTSAILEQAAAVTTLQTKYEALGKTVSALSDLQKKLMALQEEHGELLKKIDISQRPEDPRGLFQKESWVPGGAEKLQRDKEINEQKQSIIKRQQAVLKQSREEQAARQPIHEQLIKQEAGRRYFNEQQSKSATQRNNEAREGAKIAAKAEDERSKIVAKRIEMEQALKDEESRTDVTPKNKEEHETRMLGIQKVITDLKKEEQDVGAAAPGFSATAKQAKVEQLTQAKKFIELEAAFRGKRFASAEEKAVAEARMKEAQTLAGPEAIATMRKTPGALTQATIEAQIATKREAEPPSPEEMRRERVQTFQIETEMKGKAARSRGDIKTAQAAEDVSALTSNFESLLPLMGKDKAASVALAQTQQDITGQYIGASQVTSSLQAVGGGGGASQVDPVMQSNRRREELQSRMVELLQILTGQETTQPEQSTFAR